MEWKDVGTMAIKKQRRGIYDSLDSPVVPVFLEEFLFVKELRQDMSVFIPFPNNNDNNNVCPTKEKGRGRRRMRRKWDVRLN